MLKSPIDFKNGLWPHENLISQALRRFTRSFNTVIYLLYSFAKPCFKWLISLRSNRAVESKLRWCCFVEDYAHDLRTDEVVYLISACFLLSYWTVLKYSAIFRSHFPNTTFRHFNSFNLESWDYGLWNWRQRSLPESVCDTQTMNNEYCFLLTGEVFPLYLSKVNKCYNFHMESEIIQPFI